MEEVDCSGKMITKRTAKFASSIGRRCGELTSVDVQTNYLTNYSCMLCFSMLSDDALLIVERPILDVVANLPNVVYRRRYGI